MSDRSTPPPDPDMPRGSPPSGGGWRAVGPGQVERRLRLEDEEARELFFDLMERVADLSGLSGETAGRSPTSPGQTARVQAAEVTLEGERDPAGVAQPLELVLRLRLAPPDS
jgi:hypothetical protein